MIETRQRLIDATRRCIAGQGLAATTSRDISAGAEANLAAITYHFGSKDELVAEALLEALRDWLRPALDVLGGGGDPAARTMVAIQTLTSTFAQHRDEAPAYLQALVEAHRIPPLRDGVARLWADLRALLAAHITEMQGRGDSVAGSTPRRWPRCWWRWPTAWCCRSSPTPTARPRGDGGPVRRAPAGAATELGRRPPGFQIGWGGHRSSTPQGASSSSMFSWNRPRSFVGSHPAAA